MMEKLKIGQKIKKRRNELGLTQKAVAGEFMTRNMLSIIESGRATPSIESAEYLANVLDIPLSYLFSYDDNFFFYEKKDKLPSIHNEFKNGNYLECMNIIDSLSDTDDELRYIYAFSSLYLGRKKLFDGSLHSAEKYFKLSLEVA